MEGVNWIVAIIVGIFAGWVAERIMKRNHGILVNLIVGLVGLVGAVIGSWLAGLLGVSYSGILASIVAAVAGAVVLLFILGLFKRREA